MKQILQNLHSGDIEIAEVPVPKVKPGQLLIQTAASLISPGTERMLLDFGRAGLVDKARQQPDKVRQVLQKVKTDGLQPTIQSVRNKLDTPVALGYSNAGRILEVGPGVRGLRPGDRVLSNGKHAEIVCVPENLCAKIPETVSDVQAAFGVLGAIALHGVRLAEPTLGECFVVQGLGLVGLLAVQILRANGCEVLAADFDQDRVALAEGFGAQGVVLNENTDFIELVHERTAYLGADGIIICAATKSNEPIKQAPHLCRKRGRVVLVGVVGLNLSRDDFFRKEISFRVSCSYGPGRYDERYEAKGFDYPPGYVRWTENRNFQAVLRLFEKGDLNIEPFVSQRGSIAEAGGLYASLGSHQGLGLVIDYPGQVDAQKRTVQLGRPAAGQGRQAVLGFIGAGSYSGGTLIPAFRGTAARLKSIASAGGVSGYHLGNKHGFEETSTDHRLILADPEISAVVITTRHNSHAAFVLQALEAGKHVFVEKPLCLTEEELEAIAGYYGQAAGREQPLLMVGFNRRFSPLVQKIHQLLQMQDLPKAMVMTVNAGQIPQDHWTQDLETGGGRLLGEACHFIDLLRFLAQAEIVESSLVVLESPARDSFSIQLSFGDGSIGVIHYFANGNKHFPKERLEVFCGGKILWLDNFRLLKGIGFKGFKRLKLTRQDKGHANEARAFVQAISQGSPPPIPLAELFEVTRVALQLDQKR